MRLTNFDSQIVVNDFFFLGNIIAITITDVFRELKFYSRII